VECTITAEDDLLIGRLATNISAATRVDLSLCDANGMEHTRLPDIPFQSGGGSINLHESASLMKLAPTMTMIARLVAVDESGNEQQLGEYTFNHTRTIPGPAGW
jgi:hypothetical protein